jgi:TetR/AcrR family transcriptional repressor of mexJK operon
MSRKPAPATAAAKAAAPGRPKDQGKGTAILDAAKRLFTMHGFDGASMDQIAAEAGVSKLTVYSHYGDKETLFAAAVKSYCEQQLPDKLFEERLDVALRERL